MVTLRDIPEGPSTRRPERRLVPAGPTAAASLTPRARLAVRAGRLASIASRVLAHRPGSVIGGAVARRIHPGLLAELGRGAVLACVSGTNGKTTTTRMLAAALGPAAVSNDTGANLVPGQLGALLSAPGRPAVLEVDELWLSGTVEAVAPRVVVLLNLTRDQLDRTAETLLTARRWRVAAAALGPGTAVVANADDPLVAWAASAARDVTWVAAGQPWTVDSRACPACGGAVARDAGEGWWRCRSCGFARPEPAAALRGEELWLPEQGRRLPLPRALPGRANLANAVMATVAAARLGVPEELALRRIAEITQVAGRYSIRRIAGVRCRLLLAKNPAGWLETLDLLDETAPGPLVLCAGARVVDGRDTSWLYDVGFERLAGRPVAVTGRRGPDLSLRLGYAGVQHRLVPDVATAVRAAHQTGAPDAADAHPVVEPVVDVVADYSSFREIAAAARPDAA